MRAITTVAQITPEATLPVNSIGTPGGNLFIIEGSTTAGKNWFQSCDRVNLPTGSTALFDNTATHYPLPITHDKL
jgi:hypothetical protein